jgi:DNA helicase-2/ATP-dependent DNA helicase PcrA
MATGSAEEVEEERRLLYVAMTRARDQLHLIHPRRFYTTGQPRSGDRYVHAPRSRFIPPALLGHFDHGVAGSGHAEPADRERTPLPTVDLAAELRAMWG